MARRGGNELGGCLILLFACLFPPAWPALFVLIVLHGLKSIGGHK